MREIFGCGGGLAEPRSICLKRLPFFAILSGEGLANLLPLGKSGRDALSTPDALTLWRRSGGASAEPLPICLKRLPFFAIFSGEGLAKVWRSRLQPRNIGQVRHDDESARAT